MSFVYNEPFGHYSKESYVKQDNSHKREGTEFPQNWSKGEIILKLAKRKRLARAYAMLLEYC